MNIFSDLRSVWSSWKKSLANIPAELRVDDFSDIEIGCSFNPEYWILENKHYTPLFVLNYLHKELNIKSVRLGLRWNLIEQLDGTFNLDYYRPYLEYCIENNLKLTLNLGPLKTMRWPEEHIPQRYLVLVNANKLINNSHPLAGISLNYLNTLIDLLNIEFPDLIKQTVAIQGNNEAFNQFGHLSLKITTEYEHRVTSILLENFKGKNILFNTSGLNDIQQIYNLTNPLDFQDSKLTIGINYYYKVMYHHRIPLFRRLDNLVITKALSFSGNKLSADAENKGFNIEVTELQGEPWWPNALSPGSSFSEFLFTLYRTQKLKPASQNTLLVNYWGIEYLITKLLSSDVSVDQKNIAKLILNINQKHYRLAE